MTQILRVILVVGDNHQEIVKKYSADTEGNQNAFYKYERCQQHRLDVTGEEGDFSDPFPLKNGGISYSAHYDEIDWEKIHKNPKSIDLAKRAWEIVVEKDKPLTQQEENIKLRMQNRIDYFLNNFTSKEDYVNYYANLWYYGIANNDTYVEVDSESDDKTIKEWCTGFFEKYIKPLEKDNPLLTIYEVHCL